MRTGNGRDRWYARIGYNAHQHFLGSWRTQLKAAQAFDRAGAWINASHSAGARRALNFPPAEAELKAALGANNITTLPQLISQLLQEAKVGPATRFRKPPVPGTEEFGSPTHGSNQMNGNMKDSQLERRLELVRDPDWRRMRRVRRVRRVRTRRRTRRRWRRWRTRTRTRARRGTRTRRRARRGTRTRARRGKNQQTEFQPACHSSCDPV